MHSQTITVIGTEEQFGRICGKLFEGMGSLTFLTALDNPFVYMSHHTGLVIDVSTTPYSGRRDLYFVGNHGYDWHTFFDSVIQMIEMECFSRFYRVTENPIVTLKDYLEKYSDGRVFLSSWGILTSAIKEYLSDSSIEIVVTTGVCREKSFLYYYTGNGIQIKERTGGDLLVLEQADVMLQYFYINEQFGDQIPVLNFAFDVEVQIPGKETKGAIRENLFGLNKYVSELETRNITHPFYTEKENEFEYIKELEESFQLYITRRFENDVLVWRDHTSKFVHIENGMRRTCNQPKAYAGTIYFFGMCSIYGALVEDRYTIPSIIQKYINVSGKPYRAINLGNEIPTNSFRLKEVLNISSNDRIVILFPFITDGIKDKIPVIEIGEDFNRLWESEFCDKACFMDAIQHCGDYGNIVYSKLIYRELQKYLADLSEKELRTNNIYHVFKENIRDLRILYSLDTFMAELENEKKKVPEISEKIGCIVMNCNPFTLGHRYLIEYALKKVDYLYIFVVEEDKSLFSFEDRLEMVKRGTSDLKNISVVRSGKLILSANTFPTYFKKEDMSQREEVFVNEDLRIFAQYVAPVLGIQYRFVGEEPRDYVTNQYNLAMKKILSTIGGIHVVEIPRIQIGEKIISATEVRRYYCQNDFLNMRELVPNTTLSYLMEKKRQKCDRKENHVKYVVWGAGEHAHLLMDNFLGLEDCVEVFLDNDSNKKSFHHTPVIQPSKWTYDKDFTIVICVKNRFYEIYNELIFKYQCKKENIISSHEWILRLMEEQKIKLYPRWVRLETCTLCQLDCTYCYMRTGNFGTMGKGYINYEAFSKFVNENPHIHKIEISNNGEVFLNPDLGKILKLASEKEIEIVIGNGANFNTVSDEILELLVKTQVTFINLSIDGASQEIYSIYRRKGDFDKVISNIKKLNQWKEKYHSKYPILQWQYILMDHNECDVEKASLMAKELNMNIFYKYECVKGKFEPKDREKLEKITGLKYFSMEEYNRNHNSVYGADFCYQTLFSPQINFDGRLLGCCMLWNEDFGINVFEEGLINGLNSEKYLKMIRLLLGMEQSFEQLEGVPCLHCGQCGRNIRERNFLYL
ncbi:MAG: radical SAM protein [Lachnospiraceae bacterium]|nr:radical SAM protein [Lachnospiraceae bacterium]